MIRETESSYDLLYLPIQVFFIFNKSHFWMIRIYND